MTEFNLPNEVTNMIFDHLSWEQKIGVSRVTSLWRFLAKASLLEGFKATHSFVEPKKLENLTISQLGKKLVNMQYVSRGHALELAAIKRENLQKFISNAEDASLKEYQKVFLTSFAFACGVSEDKQGMENEIFKRMAEIGNFQALAKWSEPPLVNEISATTKGVAFQWAAKGQLDCLKLLLEKCGNDISPKAKRVALMWSVIGGHFDCMKYLIESCEYEVEDKKNALGWAKLLNLEECIAYLEENIKITSRRYCRIL